MNRIVQPDPTEIEVVPSKPLLGLLIIAVGAIFIFPLSIWGLFLFVIPGIAFFIFGIIFIMEGIKKFSERMKVKCPYCGKSWVVSKRMAASKCPSCRKTGVIKDGYMTAID